MKILVVKPEKKPEIREIQGTLAEMQEIVGGLIESSYPFEEKIALVSNEEGKLCNMPKNRALFDEDYNVYDIVCGTFFLCEAPSDSDSFASLSEENLAKMLERFKDPEEFVFDEKAGVLQIRRIC